MKKLVVVTGASSGMGMEFAKRFSSEGHPVLMLARRKEIMEALNLPNCLCRSVDVTDKEGMEAAIREAEALYGKTDLLINCAGTMTLGHAQTQPYEEWERMIDVNIKGILTGTRAVLADMMERNCGTIINISSIAGRKTFDNHSIYCGTKYAVHAISECMRKEASGSSVRIIVIAPGVAETPLTGHTSNDQELQSNFEIWKDSIDGGLDVARVADCAWFAYQMPQDVCVREILITKVKQAD